MRVPPRRLGREVTSSVSSSPEKSSIRLGVPIDFVSGEIFSPLLDGNCDVREGGISFKSRRREDETKKETRANSLPRISAWNLVFESEKMGMRSPWV